MTKLDTFTQHRTYLFSIAYHMLGSVQEAEDVLQEAWLRWEKVDTETVRSPRAFLSTIVTRLSIDARRKGQRMRDQYEGQWLPEPWAPRREEADYAAQLAESLSAAFMVVLEALTPAERAAYLLRQIFEQDYADIAEALDKNEANCRQLVKRATDRIQNKTRRFDPNPQEHERLLLEFTAAIATADLNRFTDILVEDAVLYTDHGGKVQANKRAILGASKIGRFVVGLSTRFQPENFRSEIHTLNGLPALVSYEGSAVSSAITLHVEDGKIRYIYAIRNPEKLVHLKADSDW
ncbi:MAG: RNA polymerase subunit sigma-24 [Candidatus Hydrogenedentota bacterium]|nr:MAG: RNA polymerase subunit sigma-24 [Candidatus Hydrogenedentota bacterium]